jgi:hypothetical protein
MLNKNFLWTVHHMMRVDHVVQKNLVELSGYVPSVHKNLKSRVFCQSREFVVSFHTCHLLFISVKLLKLFKRCLAQLQHAMLAAFKSHAGHLVCSYLFSLYVVHAVLYWQFKMDTNIHKYISLNCVVYSFNL